MLITYTGKIFDYNNITKDSIDINDILHALPSINRFLGHSARAYSVGEHTFNGLKIADKMGFSDRTKLYWLIHDFTEAYVGDCPTPLKDLLPEFKVIEKKVENAILEHLGLECMSEKEYRQVKQIDQTMLVLEMRDLTLHDYMNYYNDLVIDEIINDENFELVKDLFDNSKEIKEYILSQLNDLLEKIKK